MDMSVNGPLSGSLDLPDALTHSLGQFEKNEVLNFYARERRAHCTFMEIMNLWLVVPYCLRCKLVDSLDGIVYPYISKQNWKSQLGWEAGEAVLLKTEESIQDDIDFAFLCHRCRANLRPWHGDEMSVGTLHVEEHFAIPLETLGHRKPSRELVARIKKLYDYQCFCCGKHERFPRNILHLDHVLPQSRGGTAAFRNLQPLCVECGNAKGDRLPEEVDVFSTVFFSAPPSDSYEGLFW
jgi:5-methylcytosine-specific restriction endonuclease McrA